MINYIEYLDMPTKAAIIVAFIFFIVQIIGELLEFKGKVVPECIKIRKYFVRKKQERDEISQTLREVKELLNEVNGHYSADNIQKRNEWMSMVDEKNKAYDSFIKTFGDKLADVTQALKDNTKMTEEMFVENSRDRIIDFAEKVVDPNYIVSHEQFRRIFRVYNDYESWLEEHGKTNGEVDMNYKIIQESYSYRVNNHSFAEDLCKFQQ